MRYAVVRGQLHHLGIDQQQPDLLGISLQQGYHHGVDEPRLTRSGSAGDQHVGESAQIHRHYLAVHTFADVDGQRIARGHLLKHDEFPLRVGQFPRVPINPEPKK